jgi:hypothetical protein
VTILLASKELLEGTLRGSCWNLFQTRGQALESYRLLFLCHYARAYIHDALTADHHFEQAGFRALLK